MEDKLKFKSDIFEEYKEEIVNDKEKYKPILLELLEKNKISQYIYKEIIELWEKEWKEEPNLEIDKSKFRWNLFEEYKEEIVNDKEKYKPILLELLEKNKIDSYIYKEIIEIWEKEWKEEPNLEIDKLKFRWNLFEEYKEEISKEKERYKSVLLELLEEGKIDSYIYKEIIDIWEKDWKEEANIYIDKFKFNKRILKYYKKEISKEKERYKPLFLEVLEEDKIDNDIYKEIIELWEEEWKEVPSINIDKLKFKSDIFEEYKEEISKEKERYKPVLLELLEENKIDNDIYKEIIDIWEKDWKEVPSIDIDKLKFYYYRYRSTIVDIFNKYKKEIIKDKERYKPVLLELLEKKKIDDDIYEEIIEILEKDWKEEGEIEENPKLINIDSKDYFVENRDEIIKDREKYEETVRRSFVLNTYKEIKPILNSWGDSDIELLTKLLLKSTYETYNTLYNELKDELIENRDSIIENISKNYKTELKDKTVKLFILTTIQTVDELENKLKLLKVKDMDKLVEYLIKLNFDKDIDSEVLENVIKIVIDKISEVEYIKLLLEKSKKSLSNSSIKELVYIFDKIDSKESFDKFMKEFRFDSSINFLEYLKDKKVPLEFTKRYTKVLEKYYPAEFDKFKENLGERLIDDFKGTSYENCVEYSKYREILDNIYNYEDLMKFRVVIENGRYLNKRKISKVDIEYSTKERIKIAYLGKSIDIKKLSKVDEYVEDILPKNKKYINYEIDDLGFNDKKERYFRYNDNNIVVKLKDRKLKIFNSSGTEIKRLSSTTKDFYTVRTIENIKELKKMVKNIYTDSDNGIKKEYCNNVLRDYDLWREIYIDNVLLQEYLTNLIWEEIDSDDNIVGRFRYSEENKEFCDSNDDEYTINKENRIRLLSLDKVSNDEVDRWREQLDDYEIVQPIEQLDLYNVDYSDIDPKNVEISNKEIELGKLEKNKIGLELKFKDEEMYFEIKDILKIELEDKIKWTKYKTLSKDTIVKISKIKLLKKSDYSLRIVKLVKEKLGI